MWEIRSLLRQYTRSLVVEELQLVLRRPARRIYGPPHWPKRGTDAPTSVAANVNEAVRNADVSILLSVVGYLLILRHSGFYTQGLLVRRPPVGRIKDLRLGTEVRADTRPRGKVPVTWTRFGRSSTGCHMLALHTSQSKFVQRLN